MGGGDRKEKQVNKACALSVLQPPLLSNWNKWNKDEAHLPWRMKLDSNNSILPSHSYLFQEIGGDFLSENRASGWHYFLFAHPARTAVNTSGLIRSHGISACY